MGSVFSCPPGWGCPGVKVPDPSRKLYRGTLRACAGTWETFR